MSKTMILNYFFSLYEIRNKIKQCQKENHIQQVAFSIYHDCFTQICFNCKTVRTSIDSDEVKA